MADRYVSEHGEFTRMVRRPVVVDLSDRLVEEDHAEAKKSRIKYCWFWLS